MSEEKNKAKVVGNYTLMYGPKVARAIEVVGENNPLALLAEYDKLGGLIVNKDGIEVKTGSFFDFKNGSPRTEPQVILIKKAKVTEVREIEEGKEVAEDYVEKKEEVKDSAEEGVGEKSEEASADESVGETPKKKPGKKKKEDSE